MARGGRRNGSGRKPSAATKKTREVADAAAAKGVSPLQVILDAMEAHRAAGRLDEAARFARDAAPYMHAKLAAVVVQGDRDNPITFIKVKAADAPDRGRADGD